MLSAIRDLFHNDNRFKFGSVIVLITLILVVVSIFSDYDPYARRVVPPNESPSAEYWLGTNARGQDVFWRLTAAIGNTLLIGVIASALSRVIALINGLVSGYVGGTTDRVISTITDSFIVLPRLPLLILISFAVRENMSILILAFLLAILDWAWPGRRYRAQVLSLREHEFTRTAEFSGMNLAKLVSREHFPFLVPYLMADFISGILWAITMEVTLAVLGLADLSTPTIGTMVYWANYHQAFLLGQWSWILSPIVAAILIILSLYLLSASISQYLDPRTRIQLLKTRTGG